MSKASLIRLGLLASLVWPLSAPAATLVWSEDFDTYTSGIGNAPPAPWTTSDAYVVSNYAETTPNSLGVGYGGIYAHANRALLSGNLGYVDMWILCDDSGGVVGEISIYNSTGGTVLRLPTTGPLITPSRVWHHAVFSFNAVNSSRGYAHLYIDGVLISIWSQSGPITTGPADHLGIYTSPVSGSQIGIYVDAIKVYSGCYAPDCAALAGSSRSWLIQ